MSKQTFESEEACSSNISEKRILFNEPTAINKTMSCQEKTFPKRARRSLWCRVPKSRVIIGNHGCNVNELVRLATENSARSQSSNKDARTINSNISNSAGRSA